MTPDQIQTILQSLVGLVTAIAALVAAFKSGAARTEARAARVASEQSADTVATAMISSTGGTLGAAPGANLSVVLKYFSILTDVAVGLERIKGASKGVPVELPSIRERINGRRGMLRTIWEFEE